MFTIAPDAWTEIARVARLHDCETVLLGLPHLGEPGVESRLEHLIAGIAADAVVVRAPRRWRMNEAERILVPLGGRREQSRLRARFLASLSRSSERSVTFLRTLPTATAPETRVRLERFARDLACDEATGPHEVEIVYTDDPERVILDHAAQTDVVVMGMRRRDVRRPGLGELSKTIARRTDVPLILIGRRPTRALGVTAFPFAR